MARKAGLGWYLERITEADLLTAEEEKQLARQIRKDQDPAAREKMIQANLRLVVNVAKRFSDRGMPLSDLVAEGNLGLMRRRGIQPGRGGALQHVRSLVDQAGDKAHVDQRSSTGSHSRLHGAAGSQVA